MDTLDGWRSPLETVGTNGSCTEGIGGRGWTKLLLETLMVFMCVGAVAANLLVIIVVTANKTFHSVTSVLIVNLAVSDLLVGIGVMPFVAISVLNRDWVDCSALCSYVGYTSSVYCTSSVLTLAAIALDRYHSIIDCLRYSSRCTLCRTSGVVLWIWLQALSTSCPPLLGWSSISYNPPMYSCAVSRTSSPSYTIFMTVPSYLIPAAVILFCYGNIVKVARCHARRIHTLEDAVQRCKSRNSGLAASVSSHSPSRLVCHVSGPFVSQITTQSEDFNNTAHADAAEQNNTSSRGFFSFLAQSVSQGSLQNSQQHHGMMRLFMVISSFFLCWTPYIAVALVQAVESALSGQSTLIPSSVLTFSFWLMLLNSVINPLLYALLSKRFQNALQGLGQKICAGVGRGIGVRNEGHDCRCSDPSTLSTPQLSPPSSSESLTSGTSKYPSSIFAVTDPKRHSEESPSRLCQPKTVPSTSLWQDTAGDKRADFLQVPARPQEGSRLPFSALTEEPLATFFYGQIMVRVEHDV